jgi:exodeoxyribonuclease V beta subunit
LPSLDASLPQLRSRVTEMEFWMPAASLHSIEVDRLCRAQLLDACERPALPPRTLKGMLMGFADLVFEHQGRFWVLDYKSNRPWADTAKSVASHVPAYDRSTLQAEMARHRYDVQAAVYLLALHRQLRARLGSAYDPRRQLGGAIYWFIRGIDEPIRGEFAIAADAGVIDLVERLDRMLGLEFEVAE